MGINASGSGIAQGAKATADNFNNAFMVCNGDTGSTGSIKSERFFCTNKTTQGPSPSMNITAETGVFEFFGTATFPSGNSVDSISPGTNGQQLSLVNNSNVDILINVNPLKQFTLGVGCMVNLTFCSGNWSMASGNSTELCCDVNQDGHSFTALNAVTIDINGNFVLADSTDPALLSTHIVVRVIDANNFKIQSFGPYEFDAAHGLDDCFYFQDSTVAGGNTNLTPSVVNTYNNVLFRPLSDTKIEVLAGTRPYLIGSSSSGGGAEPTVPVFITSSNGVADASKGVELDPNGILDCSFRPTDVTYAYDGSATNAVAGSSTAYSPTNVTNGNYSNISGSVINILRTGIYRIDIDVTVSQPITGTNGQIVMTLIGASGGPRVINDHLDPDFSVSYFKGYTILSATSGDAISMSLFNTSANDVFVGIAQESILSITKLQ